MKKSDFSMRYIATVALLLFGSISIALAAISGKVTSLNQTDHTFKVQWKHKYTDRHNLAKENSHESTFKTTDKTTYWVGATKGSWANVTKGASVNVTSHNEGSEKVADKVQIVSGS